MLYIVGKVVFDNHIEFIKIYINIHPVVGRCTSSVVCQLSISTMEKLDFIVSFKLFFSVC